MFRDDDSINDLARKADSLDEKLSNGDSFYMDSEELEDILNYLMDTKQWLKAKKVVNYGMNTFPFDTTFKIKQAELFLENRNFNDAIALLDEVLELEPTNTEVLCILGDCYFQSFQHKRALDYYLESYRLDNANINLILGIIHTYIILEKTNQANYYIKRLAEYAQEIDDVLPDFVQMLFSYGSHEIARDFLKLVIDSNPYSYIAWYFLGNTYREFEKHDEALDAYEFCLAIDSKNMMAYLAKAQVLSEKGEYKNAIDFIKNNIDEKKWDADLLCSIGECYERLKDNKNAKIYYQKAIALKHPPADAYYGLAMVYKDELNLNKMMNALLQAIELDPFESLYHIELAETFLLLDNAEGCIFHYKEAIMLDEHIPEIRLDFAQACVFLEMHDMAQEVLFEMINDKIDDHRVYYRLASYAFIMGNFEIGIDYLHTALDANPSEYPLLFVYSPFVENNERITRIIDSYQK